MEANAHIAPNGKLSSYSLFWNMKIGHNELIFEYVMGISSRYQIAAGASKQAPPYQRGCKRTSFLDF